MPLQNERSLGRFIQSKKWPRKATASSRTSIVSASLKLFFIYVLSFDFTREMFLDGQGSGKIGNGVESVIQRANPTGRFRLGKCLLL